MAFMSGMITTGFLVAGLFFLKFWFRNRDLLFFIFALAFWLLAANQFLLVVLDLSREEQGWVYLLRLAAFALIVVAIVQKNVRRRVGRQP
jgi:TRAP-type C4-dicarboxylate transport system permease small subunit